MSDGGKSILLETYLLQRDALKRFLTARLGGEAEAEDLVQEMYFRLDRAAVIADVGNPTAYLYKMALNLARDHRRERQRSHARDGQWVETRRTLMGTEPIADQPLAPRGFTSIERQRRRREAERAGPMADAIVTTLLNTGLRVDELVSLTWSDLVLQPRSGKAFIKRGKGDKARIVPLNATVRGER